MKMFTRRRELSRLLLLNFLAVFLVEKNSYEQFNLCETKIYEIVKSINSQTNNESSGNDAYTV